MLISHLFCPDIALLNRLEFTQHGTGIKEIKVWDFSYFLFSVVRVQVGKTQKGRTVSHTIQVWSSSFYPPFHRDQFCGSQIQCFVAGRKMKLMETATDSSHPPLCTPWSWLIPKVLLFDPKDSSLRYGIKHIMTHTRKVKVNRDKMEIKQNINNTSCLTLKTKHTCVAKGLPSPSQKHMLWPNPMRTLQ